MTRTYRLATAATSTGASAGTATVVASGRIVGLHFSQKGTGGAGIGALSAELTLNQNGSSFAETNMPARESTIAMNTLMFGNAAAAFVDGPFIPLDVPVRPGNILNINLTQTGTAPASALAVCEVFIVE